MVCLAIFTIVAFATQTRTVNADPVVNSVEWAPASQTATKQLAFEYDCSADTEWFYITVIKTGVATLTYSEWVPVVSVGTLVFDTAFADGSEVIVRVRACADDCDGGNEGNQLVDIEMVVGPGQGAPTDGDGDGMPDTWENNQICLDSTIDDAEEDADGDGATNLQEFLAGTDPCDETDVPTEDTDGDGLPDWWEENHECLDPNNGDASEDADGDGFTNEEEYEAGTDPCDATDDPDGDIDWTDVPYQIDSDGDGCPDIYDSDPDDPLVYDCAIADVEDIPEWELTLPNTWLWTWGVPVLEERNYYQVIDFNFAGATHSFTIETLPAAVGPHAAAINQYHYWRQLARSGFNVIASIFFAMLLIRRLSEW